MSVGLERLSEINGSTLPNKFGQPYRFDPNRITDLEANKLVHPNIIKNYTEAEVETKPWKLLGSGFNVPLEAKSLKKIFREKAFSGLNPAEAARAAFNETKGNLIGFWYEYLMLSPVLPNPVMIAQQKGQNRLKNAFSGQILVDMVTRDERLGAVQDGVAIVEDELVNKDKNADGSYKKKLVVMQSAAGRSGLKDSAGRDIIYQDSQTYIFKRNEDGTIECFTVVTDMTRGENRKFLAALGVSCPRMVGDMEDLANMVKSVAVKTEDQQIKNIEDVVKVIENVKENPYARKIKHKDGRQEIKYFSEVYAGVKKGKAMLNLNKHQEDLISSLEKNLTDTPEVFNEETDPEILEKLIGTAVLEMVSILAWEKEASDHQDKSLTARNYQKMLTLEEFKAKRSFDYTRELKILRELPPGCNGGGGMSVKQMLNGESGVLGVFGPRRAFFETSSSKKCQKCNQAKPDVECGYCTSCAPPE
jgi:hypothetical protein